MLDERQPAQKEGDEAGPETEFEYWRTRMAKFNNVCEQLKNPLARVVTGVLVTAKSKVMKRWRTCDNAITDALNEAKDNVKYLSTLERFTQPLYSGNPEQIIESLPALMNNVKMMLTIAQPEAKSSLRMKLRRAVRLTLSMTRFKSRVEELQVPCPSYISLQHAFPI